MITIKEKIDKLDYIKIKNCSSEDTMKKVKKQAISQGKKCIFSKNDKELISKIY